VLTDFGLASPTSDRAQAIALLDDGKILVAGTTGDGDDDGNFALARYNPDGSLDDSFGPDGTGLVVTDFGGNDFARDLALSPMEKSSWWVRLDSAAPGISPWHAIIPTASSTTASGPAAARFSI
jgi:hypothetical protein